MAWGSELAVVLRNKTTGVVDSSSHVVKLQPLSAAYDSGAISLTQKTGNLYVWGLAADSLDDDMHYALYIDGSDTGLRYFAPNSRPSLG